MASYPVEFDGKLYRTTEALFQALRFSDEEVIEAIRAEKSPMAAKFVAKRHKDKMVVEPLSAADVNNMRVCLRLKVDQHPELHDLLLATGDAEIIEDCSKRKRGSGLFWGAAQEDGVWQGTNMLGELWMELRDEAQCSQRMAA
jgi:ribA/ribD-fused uncharacterized protein